MVTIAFAQIRMQKFFINNRFLVNPGLNQLSDITGDAETHLEPRIMQLLTILCENQGKLVTREKLIKEIWNDYGGADEGLTQAISFLRKTLDDSSKHIIQTIPKKGYILQGAITYANRSQGERVEKKLHVGNHRNLRLLIIGIIGATSVILFYAFYIPNNRIPEQPTIEVAFPGNHEEEDNNPLTTVTTTDSLGNRYRLVMIGDERPKFYVNDSLQLNQEPYDALIDNLAKELWRRQKEAENQ
jgi:DNA-binding winged helix-turn-helix (wHTH) protein